MRRNRIQSTALLTALGLMLLLPATQTSAQENWPRFRGPDGLGVATNDALPEAWSAAENVAWKTDIPGKGWSSPIVWGNRVFLTTAVNLGDSEAPKKGLYFGGNRLKPADSVHQWKVLCLDLETGKVLWERQVHEDKPVGSVHLKNSYASESPITDGEQVYAYFGNLGVYCFDLDGNPRWSKPMDPHQIRFGWGTAASPALHGDRLYIVNDNEEDSFLLALDKRTGEEVWRTPREEGSNWASPFVWENEKRTEIVTPGTDAVRSYDLDGKLLWSFTGMSSITIATPFAHNGLLYISSGYVGDRKLRPIYAIRPGAEGDISLTGEQTSNDWIAWCQKMAGPYNPSTLVYNDRLYVLYDRGLLAAFNAADGAEILAQERIPEGGDFTASPWAYGGKIFCLNEDGVTHVLNAGDKLELLRSNPLEADDMGMATPAIAGDRLLIRTAARLYCIRNGA